ncbi:MAG: hypothetical protein WBC70_01175 [Candidatus Aminicenantales bacterium]
MLSLRDEKVQGLTKDAYKKKGLKFFVIAVAVLILSIIIYSAGMKGGIIFGLISLAWIVCLISSLFYLAKGFLGKK